MIRGIFKTFDKIVITLTIFYKTCDKTCLTNFLVNFIINILILYYKAKNDITYYFLHLMFFY